jgi:hypothetical protein
MFILFCRRQTAEEREQERQAATKYFLSMQLGAMTPASPVSNAANASANKETADSQKILVGELQHADSYDLQ